MTEQQVVMSAAVVFAGVLGLLMMRKAIGQAARLVLRTAVGGGVLALLAPIGGVIGIQLGVNLYNALVIGVLGAPGLGLLLMLNWLVR